MKEKSSYSVNLSFEAIKLPPVRDILVLGKKNPQGKIGIMESFKFVAPDEFEMFDIDDSVPNVEAVLINKRILKRLPIDKVLSVLKEFVFPYVANDEAVRVDFTVVMSFEGIRGTLAE